MTLCFSQMRRFAKFNHLTDMVRAKHRNLDKTHSSKVFLVGQEKKLARKKYQEYYTFKCDYFDDEMIHAVKKHMTVIKEGWVAHFFRY